MKNVRSDGKCGDISRIRRIVVKYVSSNGQPFLDFSRKISFNKENLSPYLIDFDYYQIETLKKQFSFLYFYIRACQNHSK